MSGLIELLFGRYIEEIKDEEIKRMREQRDEIKEHQQDLAQWYRERLEERAHARISRSHFNDQPSVCVHRYDDDFHITKQKRYWRCDDAWFLHPHEVIDYAIAQYDMNHDVAIEFRALVDELAQVLE